MTSKWFISINLLLILFLYVCGCGSVKSGVKKVSQVGEDTFNVAKYKILPKKEEPKKKVLVTPFVCAWNPSSRYGEKVSVRFAKKLKKMPANILVYVPENPSVWKVIGPIPRFGIIYVPELIKDAAQLHMNYLTTGIIDVMRVKKKVNGVWPFRHFDQVFEAVMVINIIDTVTGALVESHMESAKFAIPINKIPKNKERLFIKILKNTLPSLLRKQSILVADILKKDSWKGKILQVYNNARQIKIKINAGKEAGIKEGMIFKVFEWGKKIKPPYTPAFYSLGKKIGEIKIISIKKDYSVAIALNKANYRAGLPIEFD